MSVFVSTFVDQSCGDGKRHAEPNLQFVSEPTSQYVSPDGGRAVFKCTATPTSAGIRWLNAGMPLFQDSLAGLKIYRHKLVLKLPKMSKHSDNTSDSLANESIHLTQLYSRGEFQCLAHHKNRAIISQTAKLILAELKPFGRRDNVSVAVIAGNTAVIPCQTPYSVPNAVTEFVVNSTLIDKTRERYRLMPSGDLQILNVRESDAGVYRCVAHNPFLAQRTYATHFVELSVHRQPRHHHNQHNSHYNPSHHSHRNHNSHSVKFSVSPKSHISAVTGSNVTFECAAAGSPTPAITWKKSDGHLPKGRAIQDAGNLILVNVRRGDDGTYVCMASNASPNTAVSANSVLEIQEIPQFVRKTAIDEKEVMEGQEIVLECSTKGKPRPVVDWFHNGVQITPEISNKNGIVIKGTDGSKLSIVNAKSDLHSGMYQCFATNELGSTYAMTVVNVLTLSQSQTESNHNVKEVDINENEDDSNPIENSADTELIDEEDDLFSRAPSSRRNNKNKGVKMVPPTKPEVTRLSEDSVMVRWDVPHNDGLPIRFFKVQYREMTAKGSDWNTVDDDIAPHILSYAVNGLTTGAKYRFRIAAVYSNNDNKLGPNSIKFTLFKDPPMKKPLNGPVIIHAEPVSPSAITMKWDYYDIDSVAIEGFFIYYRASISAGDYLKVTAIGANTRSHIITHLLPDTTYDIKMQCFNVAGTSDFSNIFMVKTQSSPEIAKDKGHKKDHSDNNINGAIDPVKGDKDKTLYTVIFITAGALVLVFVVCIVLCVMRHKPQTIRQNGSAGKLPKEKHPKAGANNHNHMFSHSNHNIFNHHRSNGHISNTLMAAASNGYLSRSTLIDRMDGEYPHQISIRVNPFCEISNGGSTLNRNNTMNGSFRSKSVSQHQLASNNNSVAETPLSLNTMERRKLKRMDEHYPNSTLTHSNSRLNHHNHSTSFTRLNGTLERKRRSRTDLLNASDKDNTNDSIITTTKCNGMQNAATNGTLVIMQSSC
ncbi:unnamed protein product [Medioppia subpectinata]|uniref:Interference hedgehog n=1 Tax=Medioppia subpectinata TaxID=1979941 RepID=A0A7R9KPK3_9ACAR|nr:unnamed protein product [Medioppia subpectinata]CAG2106312.1 unnamed protein product [Medioppia subpectinata]